MAIKEIPRLPLEGYIDLTYRCNNNCHHCWLYIAENSSQKKKELTLQEIRRIADEARALGTQCWTISGGEPMLRSDFPEIFDNLTRRAVTYALNTNGTLITPKIARLLKRRGRKTVALYGATSKVHDRITRNPGSFEDLMQGIAYLKEAGAGFMIQVIPMRDNWHQYEKMLELAQSLSPSFRIGAAWLFFSACGSKQKNREIVEQRLTPREVLRIDPPNPGYDSLFGTETRDPDVSKAHSADDRLFNKCISDRCAFHVDPYGSMSFCSYIKDPVLRFNLRKGSVQQAWEDFIPSLAEQIRGGEEYTQNCGSCEKRSHCRWCGVYAFLEHRRYSAPIRYLCAIADESVKFKKEWQKFHRRFFQIAGLTIQVDSDLPISETTYSPKFRPFQTTSPGSDTIHLRLHFEIPDLSGKDLGQELYRIPPLAIYKQKNAWIYLGISAESADPTLHRVAVFSHNHEHGEIYVDKGGQYLKYPQQSLSLFATDQVLLARILANRQGFSIHAAGMVIEGEGLLFIGPSEAGKSTMTTLLRDDGEVLCDENIIVRRWPDGFRIHGTWSHGDVPHVSNGQAPLRALLFLEKSQENRLELLTDKREVIGRLLPRLLKPVVTADWWEQILATVEQLVREVPAYRMMFDKTGEIRKVIHDLLEQPRG